MELTGQDWLTISKLLDQALELPRDQRESWLKALGPPDSAFRDKLRELLADRAAAETAEFLEAPPEVTVVSEGELPPSAAAAAKDLRVGPYRLLRELGRGGMAVVCLAERADGQFTRTVALKVPLAVHTGSDLAQRFARERDILAKLEHPHIARFYDAGVAADGTPYFAMEFVEGQPIDMYCDVKRLNVRSRLRLFQQVLDAVQYAHARLVIHRDLKPSNILVTADGEVHLLDFGIAKLLGNDDTAAETQLTEAHGRALTPSYASPEQIRGETLTTATDIYSLGVVLYQLLTGARPYKLKMSSPAQLELAIAEAEVVRPSAAVTEVAASARGAAAPRLARSLRGDLDTILLKALKKDAGDRYASAGALADDLHRYASGEPVLARPDSAWYRARKFVGRNRLAVGGTSVVIVALVAGMGVALWQAGIAREEAQTSAAVQGFMEDIFKTNSTDEPDPVKARKTTAEELLDIAGRKIETAMSDAPKARLRMLSILTEIYGELALNDKRIAASKLAWETASKSNLPPEDLLDSLADYEGALIEDMQLDEAQQMQDQRVALIDKFRIDDPNELGKAEVTQGILAIFMRKPDALAHLDRGIDILRRAGIDSELVNALFFKANALNGHQRFDPAGARAAALEAQAIIERIKGTPSWNGMQFRQVTIYQELARSAAYLDDPAGAVKYAKLATQSALALHQFEDAGARNSSSDAANSLVAAARPLEAVQLLDSTWHLSDQSRKEVESDDQLAVLTAFGRAQLASGRSEDALSSASRGLELAARISAQRIWPEALALLRVDALIDLGQLDAAENALRQSTGKDLSATWSAKWRFALRSELDLAHRDANAVRNGVAAWVKSQDLSTSVRSKVFEDCLLAQAALLDGQFDESQKLATDALQRIEAFAQRDALADLEARALGVRGRALLAQRDASAALPLLQRAVTLLEAVVDTRVSLRLASQLGAAARAQFGTGNVAQARETFERMKAIHAQHPNLGPSVRAEMQQISREVSSKRAPAS